MKPVQQTSKPTDTTADPSNTSCFEISVFLLSLTLDMFDAKDSPKSHSHIVCQCKGCSMPAVLMKCWIRPSFGNNTTGSDWLVAPNSCFRQQLCNLFNPCW